MWRGNPRSSILTPFCADSDESRRGLSYPVKFDEARLAMDLDLKAYGV
jgi:hypothetical protein